MRIAAYCRVSTEKEDQLNSLETQKAFFTEYAEKNGHDLVRLYADEGISGTKIKRRLEFQRMMADAERGLFDQLVVKDISRLARNTVDLLQSVRRLKVLGIQTLFLTANMDSMGDSEFILTVFGAMAQEESANMSKRIKFGKRVNAERGKVPNLIYGYDKIIGDYFNLTINEEEAAVVRQIFRWYVHDGYGAGKIAKLLNEAGAKTKRNCCWSQSGVCRILENPFYTGKVTNGRQEIQDFLTSTRADRPVEDWLVTDRLDLRIISDELFQAAGQIKAERGRAFRCDHRRQNSKYPLSTLICCKECSWSFRRISRTYQNTYVRWTCSKRNGRGVDQCPNASSIEEEKLLDQLDLYFRSLLRDRKGIAIMLRRKLKEICRGDAEAGELKKAAQDQLNRLEKMRQKYLDLYAADLITRQELEKRLSGTRAEIGALEEQLRRLELTSSGDTVVERVIDRLMKNLDSFLSVRNLNNAQMKRLISKIEVDKDGNVDVYLRLFLEKWE